MPETKIKIVSNPYIKSVQFFRFVNDQQMPLCESDPKSRLLNREFALGFFQFKAQSIADIIHKEFYAEGHTVRIIFEGPSDEFDALQSACGIEAYCGKLIAQRSPRTLSNAAEILPDIVDIFDLVVEPLAKEVLIGREKIAQQIKRFTEATSDAVPLCVVGNYSAGKSTFINALIGQELLPSGDQPTTAKVFQITRSPNENEAIISFEHNAGTVTLSFDPHGLVQDESYAGIDPYQKVLEACSSPDCNKMITAMNQALQTINEYHPASNESDISSLVSITVPFATCDNWAQSHNFAIFDTPGSNSSNANHGLILREAMQGLSDGMPIFIADHRSLDTTDNQSLYKEISQIESIDERFAIIIVNRADEASLPKGDFTREQEFDLLDKAIPRNLYSQGMYFVSSVLGLGAKTNGEFSDYNYARIYSVMSRMYSDKADPFYKELYRYDIVPGQGRDRLIEEASACENVLLANSGLYNVEQEINLFASRYSAYNKCQQSVTLMKTIAEATSAELAEKFECSKAHREQLHEQLEEGKGALCQQISESKEQGFSSACDECKTQTVSQVPLSTWKLSAEAFYAKALDFQQENREDYHVEALSDDADRARITTWNNLVNGLAEAARKRSLPSMPLIFDTLANDQKNAAEKAVNLANANIDIKRETCEDLLQWTRESFNAAIAQMSEALERTCQEFWSEWASSFQSELFQLASKSDALDESERQTITRAINAYASIEPVSTQESRFIKSELEKAIRFFDIVLFRWDEIDMNRLETCYGNEINQAYIALSKAIRGSYEKHMGEWATGLTEKVIGNIVEYNPDLFMLSKQIAREEAWVAKFEEEIKALSRSMADVERLIGWEE